MNRCRLLGSGILLPPACRPGRRRGCVPLILGALGLTTLGFAGLAEPSPRLVWNASASAPTGLYWVDHAVPADGDFVFAGLPPEARRLAAERGYLPDGVPLVKRVAALAGDRVCASGDAVSVNGRRVAERLPHDGLGRPLPRWSGCQTLGEDDVLLLMAGVSSSFDGRYFGPIGRTAVIGRLVPLWTE